MEGNDDGGFLGMEASGYGLKGGGGQRWAASPEAGAEVDSVPSQVEVEVGAGHPDVEVDSGGGSSALAVQGGEESRRWCTFACKWLWRTSKNNRTQEDEVNQIGRRPEQRPPLDAPQKCVQVWTLLGTTSFLFLQI
ncbi:hypothetical protein OsI_24808 [Oryza sativa Indica Group]|uniref:Uncharacterized protein n=2 Tax=Oryza sativa TaxID=4530 RepID=Q6ZE37_ORYSJ|nr:hypothetical protein OsI_24808 [Oryza sativa Indica Group]EAZ38618.1 hypothetical protein OsJ_23008 [Oryza sativa Japonica Group]BAC83463.1 hypothetical protein [Oryza sativa Japonica Group]